MITVQLIGGLGNQMFQYAAARALAEKNHTKVALDLSWFDQEFDAGTTPRSYELNCFSLDTSTQHISDNLRDRLALKIAKTYREPHFHYNPEFQKLGKNTKLFGYFQSENYFKDIRPTLLADFDWVKPATGKNLVLLRDIRKNQSSIAVHVRRGDYVSNDSAAKFHGLTGVPYYQAAVRQMARQVKNPHLYVFSDDPEWCKKHLKFKGLPTTYISHNKDGSEDMRLMKECQHNIIANSSFSWWGAWLNTNPDKKVIAPKQWFTHKESNTKDVVPKSWQRI